MQILWKDTITAKRYVNELVGPRTMSHLIEKKYQVTDPYSGMTRTALLASVQ